MCLIGFALDAHPRYCLIMAANRDEFHERPTTHARFWPGNPRLLAGRDDLAGGTWLGLGVDGRVAAVTNFREGVARDPVKRSRGELVSNYLASDQSAEAFARWVANRGQAYAGFSLLLFDRDGGWFVSNRDGDPHRIEPGVHALSNHLLDTPWPKVRRMREALDAETRREAPCPANLLETLADEREAAREELPDTGVGERLERSLSPPFINGEDYGTRCSTLVMLARNGRAHFEEHGFGPGGYRHRVRCYRFNLERDGPPGTRAGPVRAMPIGYD